MTSLIKNILILLAIALTGAVGYYLYINNGSAKAPYTTAAVDNAIAADTEEFLVTLNALKAVQLDGSLFSDPRFTSLTSYTQPINAQSIGKPDPFAINQ